MTTAIYLNGATLMTTPTQRVLAIAREAEYAGIEARAAFFGPSELKTGGSSEDRYGSLAHREFKSLPLRHRPNCGAGVLLLAEFQAKLDASRLLIAGGLTVWLGGLVAAVAYTRRRMRFPKSIYAWYSRGSPGWSGAIAGLILFAAAAFSVPTVAWVATVFATGLVVYGLGAYVIALTAERRRAARLGLPEPGTAGTVSFAESAVFLSIALPFAVAALALTVYGIANELGGNRAEGNAALGIGAAAWFIAIVMGLAASPLLLARSAR